MFDMNDPGFILLLDEGPVDPFLMIAMLGTTLAIGIGGLVWFIFSKPE